MARCYYQAIVLASFSLHLLSICYSAIDIINYSSPQHFLKRCTVSNND